MPADKQKPNTSKPLTPTLSSNFRNNARGTFTPRLAGTVSASPSPSLSRKEPFVRARSPGKGDQPATPLISGNITPRSGIRKSRIGTESPSTPVSVNVKSNVPRARASPGADDLRIATTQSQGLGMSSPRVNTSTPPLSQARSTPTPVVTVHRRISGAKSMVGNGRDSPSKFFHANGAKSTIGSSGTEEIHQGTQDRGPYFVGTNDSFTLDRQVPTIQQDPDEKFIRANDIPQNNTTKRPALAHIGIERPSSRGTPPQSPKKNQFSTITNPPSPRKLPLGKEPTPPPFTRSNTEQPKSTVPSTTHASQSGHRKSTSASSGTTMSTKRWSLPRAQTLQPLDVHLAPTSSPRTLGAQSVSPDTLSSRSISLASTNTVPTSVTSDTDHSETSKPAPIIASSELAAETISSPTSTQPQLDHAASARRERKVLDLEISNSSLLAINKTLERELRKQSAELRRFRRLSRSGRLSLAPTNRTVSGQSATSLHTVTENEGEDMDQGFSSGSEDSPDSDNESLLDDESSLLSNDSNSLLSSSARSRQRARDEKRLMLDLAKHQQLLIDSQKLSQSIRRCLTCTDDLIREGNKALNYRVGIGDVKLGGRVLNDEELDERGLHDGMDELQSRQGLLSPSLAKVDVTDGLGLGLSWERQRRAPSHDDDVGNGNDLEAERFSELGDIAEMLDREKAVAAPLSVE